MRHANYKKAHTVLIIEDETDQQVVMLRALKDAGAQNPLLFMANGLETRAFFEEQEGITPRLPGLIIMDSHLPDADGLELLCHLKTLPTARVIPIVVLADSRQVDVVAACYQHGASAVIDKRRMDAEPSETISLIAQYWLMTCQLPGH